MSASGCLDGTGWQGVRATKTIFKLGKGHQGGQLIVQFCLVFFFLYLRFSTRTSGEKALTGLDLAGAGILKAVDGATGFSPLSH